MHDPPGSPVWALSENSWVCAGREEAGTCRGMRPWYQAWLRRSSLLSSSSSSSSFFSLSGVLSMTCLSLENCNTVSTVTSPPCPRPPGQLVTTARLMVGCSADQTSICPESCPGRGAWIMITGGCDLSFLWLYVCGKMSTCTWGL